MTKLATVFLAYFAVAVLSLSACEKTKEPAVQTTAPRQPRLLIGLIPEQNVFRQRERYLVLGNYLSTRIGIMVNFTSLSRYGNIVERFSAEKMDGAFFGSFTYALAHSQLGVEAIARPVNLDGTSTYRGYVFARKDSGIRTVADMKGKRFVFVDRATMAGYLFPLAHFKEYGISDPRSYLGEVFFAGSHDAVIQAVLNKEADIGAAKNTIFDQTAAENPRIQREMTIIATSEVVPQNCLAVRKDLDRDLKRALMQALFDMENNEEGREALRRFGARDFIETSEKDYAYFYRMLSQVGVDLKKYQYKNE